MILTVITLTILAAPAAVTAAAGACARPNCLTNKNCPPHTPFICNCLFLKNYDSYAHKRTSTMAKYTYILTMYIYFAIAIPANKNLSDITLFILSPRKVCKPNFIDYG